MRTPEVAAWRDGEIRVGRVGRTMAEWLLVGRVLTAAIGPWAASRGVSGFTRGHLGDFLGKGFPARESDSEEGECLEGQVQSSLRSAAHYR